MNKEQKVNKEHFTLDNLIIVAYNVNIEQNKVNKEQQKEGENIPKNELDTILSGQIKKGRWIK